MLGKTKIIAVLLGSSLALAGCDTLASGFTFKVELHATQPAPEE